jgi:hypothetical protein
LIQIAQRPDILPPELVTHRQDMGTRLRPKLPDRMIPILATNWTQLWILIVQRQDIRPLTTIPRVLWELLAGLEQDLTSTENKGKMTCGLASMAHRPIHQVFLLTALDLLKAHTPQIPQIASIPT